MELIKVIEAGYTPTILDGAAVVRHTVDHTYEVLRLHLIDGTTKHVAYSMDHKRLPLEFVMHVSFNEDTAAALLLSGVAPLMTENIDKEFPRKMAIMRNEQEREARERTRLRRGIFES